jgi:hypothetical protein
MRARTRDSAMKGLPLTAWAMVQPQNKVSMTINIYKFGVGS